MVRQIHRTSCYALFFSLISFCFVSRAAAQYTETNLVGSSSSVSVNGTTITPNHVDPNLINGWGVAFFGQSPFWVSDQNTSLSTLYKSDGTPIPLVVQIPCVVSGSPVAPCPKPAPPLSCRFPNPCLSSPPVFFGSTGMVFNPFASAGDFAIAGGPARFIFDTLDGLIVGWNSGTAAMVAANESSKKAIYFGLAIAGPMTNPHLYAANGAAGGMINVFDTNFKLVNSFAADRHPGPFTPYGIQTIGDDLYVTYAAAPPTFGGILDVCELRGNTVSPRCHRIFYSPPTSHKFILNSPWGIALAPSNFGPLSNKLLVGNVNDGLVRAFIPEAGGFVGTLKIDGKPFSVPGLWALTFGTGEGGNNSSAANQLFFAAGPGPSPSKIFSEGLFGVIAPALHMKVHHPH